MPTVTVHPVLSPVKHGGRKVPPGGTIPAAALSDDEARALILQRVLGPAEEREVEDDPEHDAPNEISASPIGPPAGAEGGDDAAAVVTPTSTPPAEKPAGKARTKKAVP